MTNTPPKKKILTTPNPIKLPIAVPIGQGKYMEASLPKSKKRQRLLA